MRRASIAFDDLDPESVALSVAGRRRSAEFARLTERECDVLTLMAEGQSNAGVGSRLFLSPKTVEAHVSAIFAKLQLPPSTNENRRVLAVLGWLRVDQDRAALTSRPS